MAVDASNNVLTSANAQSTRYWFKDHLGSPASEYDAGAVNLTPLGFDTWGLRRKNTAANTFTQSLSTADLASYQSPRGYTGHEHLDDVGLIHMNGRIYDPMIGRFLQPDPVISEPYNSQNFNRYAYVLNNPLMYTDPSGYSTWTEVRRPVVAIVVAVVAQWAAGYAMTAFAGAEGSTAFAVNAFNEVTGEIIGTSLTSTGSAVAAAAGGFASGGVSGGNIESAIAGAFQAVALFGVGEGLGHGGEGFGSGTHVARIAAHATIGCVSSGVQGGSCGAGAASAGFAAFAGPVIDTGNFAADLAGHAIAGGVGARLSGGKFGNGALTGAFGYLFNRCGADPSCLWREAQESYVKAWTKFYGQFAEASVTVLALAAMGPAAPEVVAVGTVAKEGTIVLTKELVETHGLTMSKKAFKKLLDDIKVNGIKEPIKYVEELGGKHIVDGHHRTRAAKSLGLETVPAQKVTLPYSGYKTTADLIWTPF